jgi:hypothetical protein
MSDYDEIIQEENLLQQQYQQDLSDPLLQQQQDDMLIQQPQDYEAFQQQDDYALIQQQDDALSQMQYQQQQDDALIQQQQDDEAASQSQQAEILDEFRERQEQFGQAQQDVPVEYEPGAGDLDEPGRIPELDSGYDPYWAPEGAHRFPAESKGEWIEGGKGDGWWQPYDPGAYGLEDGDSIPFREGVPDFSDYAFPTESGAPGVFDVSGLTGDGRADYSAAVAQLADQEGMTFRECQQWLSKNELRLHHYGGDEMQIVPERLHGALGHQGSATEKRE